MRGFAIILMVIGHVLMYGFHGDDPNSMNRWFVTFAMPVFFFISGFVMYRPGTKWNVKTSVTFLGKKMLPLVVAPLIFLALYAYCFDFSAHQAIFSNTKIGYWFTLELFQFFCIYIVVCFLFDRVGKAVSDTVLGACVVIAFFLSIKPWSFIPFGLYQILGMCFLKHFVFFYAGLLAKRNLSMFSKITDDGRMMAFILIGYLVVMLAYYNYYVFPLSLLIDVVIGVIGIVAILALFRKREYDDSCSSLLDRSLQFIGSRTLDIYFIHFFFLPRNLASVGTFFQQNSNPVVELLIALALSMAVIGVSLFVGNIIRLSPELAHCLLGVKYKREIK